MVLSMRKTATFLAISLVAAVISLASNGYAASMPTSVVVQPTWAPVPGFGPVVGKVVKDSSDNLYAVDYERRGIVKMWQSGAQVLSSFISTPAALGKPYGLAVMKDGTMVVTFIHPQPKVALLDPAGALLTQQGALATANFQQPTAVALDSQENIYVLDAGKFKSPIKKAAAGDGYPIPGNTFDIFVPGTNRTCVQVFTKAGAAIATGVSASPVWNGTIGYPTNSFGMASRLQQTDAASTTGTLEPGMFMVPEGLFYDSTNKELLVVDTLNGRVQFFGTLDNPTPAKRFVYQRGMGNFALEASNEHMTMPVGAAIENHMNGPRMYVVDKVLQRIQVFDLSTSLSLGIIDGTTVPGLEFIYPRDILFYKGNLLVANEQGGEAAMLKTLSIDGAAWPPLALSPFTFDYAAALAVNPNFPNITQRAGNTFPFTGKAEVGATVTWTANEGLAGATSGTCTPNPVAADENYTCNVVFRTTSTDQYVVLHGAKGSVTSDISLHVSYTTAVTLPYVAPLVTFNPIASTDLFRKGTTISVSGTVDYRTPNPGHTGNNLTVEVLNNRTGQRTLAVVDTAASGNVKSWTATVPLAANTDNTLTPSAFVELSPRGVAAPQVVTVDQVAPTVSVSFLEQGAVTLDQIQNIAGTIDEDNLASVSVLVNAIESSAMFSVVDAVNHVSYYSALGLLSKNGVNTVQVRAIDKAGNETLTDPVTVTLAPMYLPVAGGKLTSTLPADNFFYTSPGVALTFSGTLPTGTTALSIGLDSCTPTGATYSCSSTRYATLEKKIIPVHLSATAAGKTVQKMRSLYIDSTRPDLAITTPKEDLAVNTNSITIAGTVKPSTAAPGSAITQVFIKVYDSVGNEKTALAQTRPVSAGAFTSTAITLPNEGRFTVTVSATNGVGQTTVATRNLIYDTVKPSVGIAIESSPAVLEGYFEAGATIDVKYNNVSVAHNLITFNDSIWSVSTAAMPNLNLVSVVATDPAGNTNTRSYTATVPDVDTDGDGVLRTYDAIQILRLAVSGLAVNPLTLAHSDVAPLVNGKPAPDGLITVDDALAVLMKVEGKPWL